MPDEIEITHIVSNIDTQRTIKQEELQGLRWAAAKLEFLESYGLKDWDRYDEAMVEWQK